MLASTNDYPTSLPRHALRSALWRTGMTERLGRLYWGKVSAADYIDVIYARQFHRFQGIPTDFADPAYSRAIDAESVQYSKGEEQIICVSDCWVEPNRCQVIGPDGRLVAQSVSHQLLPLYPSAIGFALRGSGVRLPAAIVYDGISSINYFHHIVDCLPRLVQLDQYEDLRRLPLMVNRWVFESPFFAYLYRRSAWFRERDWLIVEPGQWTHVDRAYLLKPKQYEINHWNVIRRAYGKLSEPKGRRIFLSRDSRKFSRGIVNEAEVSALLRRYGFETVYAEHLSMEEQQRTFEEAEYLVALQGMGMIQQLFMDPDTARILEIMPSSRLQTEYYWQGWTCGVPFYDVQLGSALVGGRYVVDTGRLTAGVDRMVTHPPGAVRYGETFFPAECNSS